MPVTHAREGFFTRRVLFSRCGQFAPEPGPGMPEIAMHGGFGDPERLAGFEASEPAEVAQLDDPRLTRIEHLEAFHGGVERKDRYRVRVGRGDGAGEGDVLPVAAAFERMFAARVLDQDPAHHARRDAEEMRAILPVHIRVDEPQIGFMDQRRGLERMSLGLAPELSPRQATQLCIHERNQPVVRPIVPEPPFAQQLGHTRRIVYPSLVVLRHDEKEFTPAAAGIGAAAGIDACECAPIVWLRFSGTTSITTSARSTP
jgi:hypothetical protein